MPQVCEMNECVVCKEETEKTVILKSGTVIFTCDECLTTDVRDFRPPEKRLVL